MSLRRPSPSVPVNFNRGDFPNNTAMKCRLNRAALSLSSNLFIYFLPLYSSVVQRKRIILDIMPKRVDIKKY